MSAETVAILDKAADVIERNGLHKEWYYDEDSGKPPAGSAVDTHGAINIATVGQPIGSRGPHDITEDAHAARQALRDHINSAVSLAIWNDMPDRTAEQVITALRGAAQAERERAS